MAAQLLGNTVLQYSLTLGLFISGMGTGAFFSRFIRGNFYLYFILIEIILGSAGGISAFVLYLLFARGLSLYPYLCCYIFFLSTLIGLEIPLMTLFLEEEQTLDKALADILTLDYFGAFLATILFPFFLLPYLGFYKTALVAGTLNICVSLMNSYYFREKIPIWKLLFSIQVIPLLIFYLLLNYGDSLAANFRELAFKPEIIASGKSEKNSFKIIKIGESISWYYGSELELRQDDKNTFFKSFLAPINSGRGVGGLKIAILGGEDMGILEYLKDVKLALGLDFYFFDTGFFNFLHANLQSSFKLAKEKLENLSYQKIEDFEKSREKYDLILVDLPGDGIRNVKEYRELKFLKVLKEHLSLKGQLLFSVGSTGGRAVKIRKFCTDFTTLFPASMYYKVFIPCLGVWMFLNSEQDSSQTINSQMEKLVHESGTFSDLIKKGK
ncbi:spermidine synthase [Candidatus Riflebacteria bacterium]